MPEVTLSSKFQIVIPAEIRKRLNLKAGQKLQLIVKDNMISLIPDLDISDLRGLLQGMDTRLEREEEDRL